MINSAMTRHILSGLILTALSVPAVLAQPGSGLDYGSVPVSAEDISPLSVGDTLPGIILRDVDGEAFDLNAAIAGQKTVLIFYRGGWCPYCNVHMGGLAAIENDLKELGFQLLAVSPDRPEKLLESIDEHDLPYTLLSDSDMAASMALGIAFRVADETVARYLSRGIDLEGDSGFDHHLLPVPAAFVVDTEGVIGYAYVNSNYRVRIENEALLEAASSAVDKP